MTTALAPEVREERTPAVDLEQIIACASAVVAPVWPINTFIACNPLQGLEELPFDDAFSEMARLQNKLPAWEAVGAEMIKWTSTFLDEGQARIPMPGRERGFYAAVRDLGRFDSRFARIRDFPETAEATIDFVLNLHAVPVNQWEEVLKSLLASLPGWAGHVKWREHWDARSSERSNPITLTEFLAVYLLLADLLGADLSALSIPAPAQRLQSNLAEREAEFRHNLVGRIKPEHSSHAAARPDAQFVFCIDVRSEPFRRSLEAQGNYQTFGFAGFFGLPVAIKSNDGKSHASCPVLLRPRYEVCEQQQSEHPRARWIKNAKLAYQSLKYNAVTPFALVELLGPWLGLTSLLRTLAPSMMQKISSVLAPKAATQLSLESIPLAEQADLAENALRGMGLTQGFAPFVVFCGHGSTTTNNAYASALNCGACGGHHGGPNARILAAILNQDEIRSTLRQQGLSIPNDTVFLAAEHDTTTGHVELYDNTVTQLKQDLEKASQLNFNRSADWAQPRPEWGLARNAAFIVGPRELTRNIDLDGRCFLHSYDSTADEDGAILTNILTAPMVVAQWINSQYLFSTLDNVAFGSGSKITKNIVGKIGVMQGNASDLMHGLPLQSVFAADNRAYHEPLRLLTVVYAPRERVKAIIKKQAVLQKLFVNQWVSLVVIDPQDETPYLLDHASLEFQPEPPRD